ncbi:MAG: hypothetical protein U9O96_02355, partial [Candidatus Thermoplasmatota archaeon]|nr:hypothetical protein [Candidatus Thermoplasmatota archaeon]
SSTKKISEVLKYFNNEEIDKIGDFFSDSKIKEKDATALYDSMCHKTKAFSERSLRKTLGCIGKKGMTHSLLESLKMTKQYESVEEIVDLSRERDLKIQNINDLIVYYSKGGVTKTDKVIPFFFEMITIPLSGKKQEWNCSNNVTFGINQSFIYSLPEIWLFFNRRGGESEESHNGIKQSFRFDYNFKIICNLTCPTIDFQDKGKQLFDTEPFSDAIAEVVGKTIRKITNEIIPTLNKLNKPEETTPDDIYGKAPKGFIKDFVFRTFESIYNEATDNGTFTITQRQLFYAMRPVFHNTIKRYGYRYTWDSNHYKEKKLELEYKTFCGYVDDYEVNVLAKRIIYKKHRGFFVEPHSNRHVNLGTRDVKEYNPDLKQYNNLLFVEKSGFYELLHNDFQLTKRYDIGLINSEGYATNAIRDLIEKIQRKKPGIKLYVLTDFDIDGLGIARNIKKAEELSAIDVFDCKRIGITFDDIGKYNLQAEPVDYPMSKMTELNNQYINDRVSDDVYNFLKEGQRIE